MAIITYDFNYDFHEAIAVFKVDTEKFTQADAQVLLDFFRWETGYDKDENPIDELMKKYAMQAIQIATSEEYNVSGVQSWFEENEGFPSIDGSKGIELVSVSGYEFDEGKLHMELKGTK